MALYSLMWHESSLNEASKAVSNPGVCGTDKTTNTNHGEKKGESPLFLKNEFIQQRLRHGFSFENVAAQYASQVIRSEAARVHSSLHSDLGTLLSGNAVYIKNFLCVADDRTYYNNLKKELLLATGAHVSSEGGLIEWSKHQAFENPSTMSPTFNSIIEMLSSYFDLEVYATRLNYYRDGSQWKPQHHDSHAYGDKGVKEDFTAGVTLGSNRSLLFVHVESHQEFSFPQNNGDCFAFSTEVNRTFTHGVPRVTKQSVGDRFSIIAWGRRRSINERNGRGIHSSSLTKLEGTRLTSVEDVIAAAHILVSSDTNTESRSKETNDKCVQKKKKNRLQ